MAEITIVGPTEILVLARYRGQRAVVAPRRSPYEALTPEQASRIAQKLRSRFDLPGARFWVADYRPLGEVAWEVLRARLDLALQDPAAAAAPEPAMLTEKQAAARCGLSVDALRHEVNSGRLSFIGDRPRPAKVKRRRFEPNEIDRWLADRAPPSWYPANG